MLAWLDSILSIGTKVIDRVIPDPVQKEKAKLEFLKLAQEGEFKETEQQLQAQSEVNQTIRTEAQSDDKFVRRWRPFFGYCLSISWCLMFIFIIVVGSYAIIYDPAQAVTIITALGSLLSAVSLMWSVALAVLGVYIKKRSDDKKTAANLQTPGLIESIKGLIK